MHPQQHPHDSVPTAWWEWPFVLALTPAVYGWRALQRVADLGERALAWTWHWLVVAPLQFLWRLVRRPLRAAWKFVSWLCSPLVALLRWLGSPLISLGKLLWLVAAATACLALWLADFFMTAVWELLAAMLSLARRLLAPFAGIWAWMQRVWEKASRLADTWTMLVGRFLRWLLTPVLWVWRRLLAGPVRRGRALARRAYAAAGRYWRRARLFWSRRMVRLPRRRHERQRAK